MVESRSLGCKSEIGDRHPAGSGQNRQNYLSDFDGHSSVSPEYIHFTHNASSSFIIKRSDTLQWKLSGSVSP